MCMIISRFPCNRWLGTGVDDGSTERLLVAARMRSATRGGAGAAPSPAPAATPTTTHLSTSTIQHMIGTCYHYMRRVLFSVSAVTPSDNRAARPMHYTVMLRVIAGTNIQLQISPPYK